MPKITFNLSRTSFSPGWNPDGLAHDDLWQDFAAGYTYKVAGSLTEYDSLRASDPATGGTTDTFSSASASLDLMAHNYAGDVSLNWYGEVAQLTLDSAWNTIKNAYVSDFSGHQLVLQNWVDAWISLDNNFGQNILVDGTKRAEISTGSGDDTIWIGVDSNSADWSNHIKIDAGAGNDHITVALSTKDYSGSAFAAAYNPAWTTTELNGGAGDDTIEGGKNADTIDGGTGFDTVILHGNQADYQVTTVGGITTITDLRPQATNMDGIDHLTNVEFLQFKDVGVPVIDPTGPDPQFGLFGPHDLKVGATGTFTIVLADPAGAGGQTVSISISPLDAATVTTSINLAEGQSTATFSVVAHATDFTVNATAGASSYSSGVHIDHTPADPANALSDAGLIAFTGINTDGDNDIAFVALTDIAPDRTIEFGNGWSNGAFTDPQSHWTWTPPAQGVAAGTVVRIDHIHTANGISATIGTVTGSGDLTGHDEAVFAYTSQFTTAGLTQHFLTGISNSTFEAAGSDLTGTGLATGVNALEFGSHVESAAYAGNRTTPHTAEFYQADLSSTQHWTTQAVTGNGFFSTTHFDVLA